LSSASGLSDNESIISTDSGKLNQILTNLVNNALKFTTKEGIDFGYRRQGNMLEFYVIDSGIGIPREMHERVFERFHQVDNSLTRGYEGAGLGLSITKSFVELLGGTISVESVERRGSTFFFTLPYKPFSGLSKTETHSSINNEPATFTRDLTILIAEDDMVSSMVLAMFLTSENITTLSAVNGVDAVKMVQQYPEINLVLKYLKMPIINGLEAIKLIKQYRPRSSRYRPISICRKRRQAKSQSSRV